MSSQHNRTGARPTLEAVAARAGVGRGTVSRVINRSPKVSADTRAVVLRAIDELGYVPNRAARALVTRRTDTIALVVSESEERVFTEPFFVGAIRGISRALVDTGVQLILAMANSPVDRKHLESYLADHVDGVLLLSQHAHDSLPQHLEERGLPTVLCGRPTGFEPSSYVDADNHGGARQAVDHLTRQGRRRIATITGPLDMNVGVDRLNGYLDGLSAAGLPVDQALITHGDFSEDSGAAGMRELLARRVDLDAVFAASDLMAAGAIGVLKEGRRRIPDDVAVVGFENSAMARHTDPSLTTIHQPVEDMGSEMTRLLLARIAEKPLQDPVVVLPTHLVRRASA